MVSTVPPVDMPAAVSNTSMRPHFSMTWATQPRALGHEQTGRGRADARRGAGDDGDFILELHGASLAREASPFQRFSVIPSEARDLSCCLKGPSLRSG